MKKDKIDLVDEHWDCFAIYNDQGDPTLHFDCTFKKLEVHSEKNQFNLGQ